jgi:hypothetical protein
MNIRITTFSFSLIIAATCGIAFNQAANAGEEDVRSGPSMRFDFGSNNYRLDSVSPRRHTVGTYIPSSVKSGAAPKNLLGLDPNFVKPVPAPAPAPAPVAQPTVAAKPILPSAFTSLFGHPTAPLVAQAPGTLPATTPAASAPKAGHLPSSHYSANKGVHAVLVKKPAANPMVAAAAPASYGKYFQQGDVHPGYGGNASGGSVIDTSLIGKVIHHK